MMVMTAASATSAMRRWAEMTMMMKWVAAAMAWPMMPTTSAAPVVVVPLGVLWGHVDSCNFALAP